MAVKSLVETETVEGASCPPDACMHTSKKPTPSLTVYDACVNCTCTTVHMEDSYRSVI